MPDWLDNLRRYPIPGLSCPELAVLRVIAERSDYNTGRNARPSMRTIAWAAALGTAAARRAVRALEGRGLIVAEVGGGRTATRYVVVVDAVRAMIRMARPIAPIDQRDRSDRPAPSERSTSAIGAIDDHLLDHNQNHPPEPPDVAQLALALLEVVAGGGSNTTKTERDDAAAAAAELAAAGLGPDDVATLVHGWRAVGWDPAKITTRALCRQRGKLLAAGERAMNRARAGHTDRASWQVCKGTDPDVEAEGRAVLRAALRGAARP